MGSGFFKISFIVCLILTSVSGLGNAFIPNKGQFLDQFGRPVDGLLYMGSFNGLNVQIFNDHFAYEIKIEEGNTRYSGKGHKFESITDDPFNVRYSRVEFYFGQQAKSVIPSRRTTAYNSYFGPASQIKELYGYSEILLTEVFENVDVQFLMGDEGIKYNFIVHTGGNPEDIQLEIKGGNDISIDSGQMIIGTEHGDISENIPQSYYYDQEGVKRELKIEYQFLHHRLLSFVSTQNNISNLNTDLIIDPVPDIIWATYAGGAESEYMEGVVLDSNQNICATGFTSSTANIATTGAYDGTFDGVYDIYLVKYDPNGNKIWGTYYGGASYDRAYGITCSNDNSLFITGNTYSPGMATAGVHQTFQVNADEAFVAKFNDDGFLIWSTYYGGDQHDFGAVIEVDGDNNTYITGHTYSTNYIATLGMYKETFTGLSNAYIAKFNDNGLLEWATYYGEQLEEGWGIGLDGDANVYITGSTQSTFGISSPGVHQETFAGYNDAFLAKFSTDGLFLWGTYYGDVNNEQAYGMKVTEDGHAFITGITSSPTAIAYGNVYQPTPASIDDGFVAKFNPDGTINWGTYVGGDGADYIYNIDFGVDSNIVICGMTLSIDGIALPNAYDDTWEAFYDGFIISLDQYGDYRFGTYYGDDAHDEPRDVVVDPTDLKIVIVGTTASQNGLTTLGAESETYPGGTGDTFIARFCNPVLPKIKMVGSTVVCDNEGDTAVIENPGSFTSFTWSTAETSDSIEISGLFPGSYAYYIDAIDTNGCASVSDTLEVNFFEAASAPSVFTNVSSLCQYDTLIVWTFASYIGYEWNSGGTDTLDLISDFSGSDSIDVSVTVTDNNGCKIASDTLWVDILPLPDASITIDSPSPFCIDDSIYMSVDPTASSYNWNNGDNGSTTFYTWPISGNYDVIVEVENAEGCSESDTLKISISNCGIGFEENELTGIEIFPIPFSDIININFEEDIELKIYSMSGQLVFQQGVTNKADQYSLDLSYLKPGVYHFVFLSEEGRYDKKVLKVK